MFVLVALLCFYSGFNNIKKSFALAPFPQWTGFNWVMLIIGILLILVGIRCTLQAIKDLEAKKQETEKKQEEEIRKRQRQFFYDDADINDKNK